VTALASPGRNSPAWLQGGPARWLGHWLILVAGAGSWQAWADWRQSAFFPPPSAIVARMHQLWFSGPARHLLLTPAATGNVLPSLGRTGAGLAIAVAVGLPLGITLGRSPMLAGYLDPVLQFGRALPAVALVTVFIVIFKLGTEMETAFIAFGAMWPILLNTEDGARSIDPQQVQTARAFRLPAGQRLIRLVIPATMPKFFTGLRISVSLALVLMVIAELTGSSNGIGYEMNAASSNFDLTGLWAGIALLGVLGYLLNAAVAGIEHVLLRWHRGVRRAGR
jgi:ABC-type nitrate/sulfonate/bicarbonate transport system permease component